MSRKRLFIVLGVLALFVLVFSAVALQRQSSNLKALQASAIDFCSKESVKVDGQELRLQAKEFVKLTDSAKEQYGVRDAEGQKTLLLEFAVLETATQTETPQSYPLILKASLQDGKWILDEKDAHTEALQKLLFHDFVKEYSNASNKEFSYSYDISLLSSDNRIESVNIKSNDAYAISYKALRTGDKNIYEFSKTIKK